MLPEIVIITSDPGLRTIVFDLLTGMIEVLYFLSVVVFPIVLWCLIPEKFSKIILRLTVIFIGTSFLSLQIMLQMIR